jgi:hypothetical protein
MEDELDGNFGMLPGLLYASDCIENKLVQNLESGARAILEDLRWDILAAIRRLELGQPMKSPTPVMERK